MAMTLKLDIAHRSRPKRGEYCNGDLAMVRQEGLYTLFAVVDSLGHGPGAAEVSKLASDYLVQTPLEQPILPILQGLHQALANSRGAAAMVCLFDGQHLHYGSVGNVDMRSLGTRVQMVQTPGILGRRLRKIHTFDSSLSEGSRLVLFSDGISSRLELDSTRQLCAADACRTLLEQFGRVEDDATVLVADVSN